MMMAVWIARPGGFKVFPNVVSAIQNNNATHGETVAVTLPNGKRLVENGKLDRVFFTTIDPKEVH